MAPRLPPSGAIGYGGPWASPSPTSPAPAAAAACSTNSRSELDDGAVLALRGANGAGKSTLLRAVAGLVAATGRIALDGRPLDADLRAEAVAYAGHLDAVRPQLSVAEHLRFWAALAGGDAAAGLAAFGLAAIAERPAALLSAGQRRRLALSRLALAPRRLWLLDEPSAALDADGEARLDALLRAHAAAGGVAIVATHGALAAATEELRLEPAAAGAAADPFLAAGAWA